MAKKLLEVKNLRISFNTNTGTVKAVRGINFALERGRTLAIVGESGSGKSVTSKAILGILANNSIIEDGEIIYDGKNLLSLNEEQFSEIRGVKISMIFQDPLSALNPIMHVGKQLTEAMYLEHKAQKRLAKRTLNKIESLIRKNDAELAKKLIEKRKNAKESLEPEAFDDLKAEIKAATEKSNQIYLANLAAAQELVISIKQECLGDYESYDRAGLSRQLSTLKLALKKCVNVFSLKSDNIIDVYIGVMKKNMRGIIDTIKYSEHLAKTFEKHGVDDVFDLPASVRCKEREVVKPVEEYFLLMQQSTDELIEHLGELQKKYSEVNDELVEKLVKVYIKNFKTSISKLTHQDTKKRAIKLMKEVGIPEPERRFNQYPFEFSGGMRQRIVIAIALSGNPEILICDEPTTALDVTIQAQILELINRLKEEKNLSIIFITHDLGVVANMADDIAVMYAGKIVEYGTVYDIFYDPRHPYTWALLGSMPDLETKGRLDAIPGTPPNMLLPPKGDAFAARNMYAVALDYEQEAPFFQISETHSAKAWLLHNDAPDVVAPRTVVDRIYNSLAANPDNRPVYDLKKNSILEYKASKKGGKK